MGRFIGEISDIEGSTFIQPFQAPVDQGNNSDAIVKALGVGANVYTDVQKESLKTELETARDSAVGTAAMQDTVEAIERENELLTQAGSDYEYTADELSKLKAAKGETNKLEKAFQSGRIRETEFNARVENILRGYINRAPGIAAELRGVASGILGFDPTGSELQNAFAAQQSGGKQAAWLLKQKTSYLIKNDQDIVGLDSQGIDKLYIKTSEALRKRTASKEIMEDWKNRGVVDEAGQKELLQQSQGGLSLSVGGHISAIIKADQPQSGEEPEPLTQAAIDAIPSERRAEMVLELEKGRRDLRTNLNVFDAIEDVAYLDSATKGLQEQYTDAIELLQDTGKLAVYKGKTELMQKIALSDIISDPRVAGIMEMYKVFGDNIPSSVSKQMEEHKIFELTFEKLMKNDGTQNPLAASQRLHSTKDQATVKANTTKVIDGLWDKIKVSVSEGKFDEEPVKQIVKVFKGMSYQAWEDADKIDLDTMDLMFKSAESPEMAALFNREPQLKAQFKRAATSYHRRTLNALGSEISSFRDHVKLDILANGEVEFYLTGERADVRDAQDTIATVNSTYGDRLNRLIKSTAHLSGTTDYRKAAISVLQSGTLGNTQVTLQDLMNNDSKDAE